MEQNLSFLMDELLPSACFCCQSRDYTITASNELFLRMLGYGSYEHLTRECGLSILNCIYPIDIGALMQYLSELKRPDAKNPVPSG